MLSKDDMLDMLAESAHARFITITEVDGEDSKTAIREIVKVIYDSAYDRIMEYLMGPIQ